MSRDWNPKFTPEQIIALEYGLDDAQHYYEQLKGINDPGMSFKEVKDELLRMQKALNKLLIDKGTKSAALKTITATCKAITPDAAKQIDIFTDDPYSPIATSFKSLAQSVITSPDDKNTIIKLDRAISDFLADLKEPGKGGAKRDARKFIMPLQKLAQHFNEIFPDRAISLDDTTLFYDYCLAWFEKYQSQVKDPKRHIKNMIEDLPNWKINPLSSRQ